MKASEEPRIVAASVRRWRLARSAFIGRRLADERLEGACGNQKVPPLRGRRGSVGRLREAELWGRFPPREGAGGDRRSTQEELVGRVLRLVDVLVAETPQGLLE